MDNKQAIEQLKALKKSYVEYDKELKRRNLEAIDKAIASLEAWDKVIEELKKEIKDYDNVLTGLDYCTGVGYALEIINEYLKEIEK